MKQAYKCTLEEWECLLDQGPVTLTSEGTSLLDRAVITRLAPNCYAYRNEWSGGHWDELQRETLLELFLDRALGTEAQITQVVVDAVPTALLPQVVRKEEKSDG